MILIVDDEPDVLFLLRVILSHAGYEVVEAPHGVAALERIREATPAVVVTDMMMPVMDGRELISRLRADPATADVPIMLVSAMPVEDSGADAFMPKPFESGQLLRSIAELMDRRRPA